MSKIMRLFIAINFDDDKKEYLNQTIQELKKHTVKGSFTQKENLHLTLAFIGETKELEQIKNAMNYIVTTIKAKVFQITLDGVGTFKRKEGDIYWIGVKQNPILSELNRALIQEIKKYVYEIDERELKPHLTLGRRVEVKKGFDLMDFGKSVAPIDIEVDRISLMQSERIEGKLVYTEIYNCKLYRE